MTIYIDTTTFAANPALYADAGKTQPLPRVIPVVEGWAQELKVAFLGDRIPADGDTVFMVFSPPGMQSEVARSTDGVRSLDAAGNPEYTVNLALDTSAMRVLLGNGKTLNLLAGVLVTNAEAGTRIEYQFRVTIHESVVGVWQSPVSFAELNLALGEARRARDAAKTSETNAGTSATNAATSERNAAKSASAAKTSETNAANSASTTKTSETNAANSASAAKSSETAAKTSETNATTKATEAATSAKAAKTSETNAGTSAENAATSEQNAAKSASAAKTSETNAANSASAAKTSETNAGSSATNAATSARNASNSASAASTSETNAATSASAAKTSETNAGNSAKNAADSAAAAKSYSDGINLAAGIEVLNLGTKTILGADAFGLKISATEGIQIWGTHFLTGTLWGDDGLKVVNNNISLTTTDAAYLGFDYANKVTFRTMPNDGNEATYALEAWEWTDASHTVKAPTAGVKLLKPSQATVLVPESVLNLSELDARFYTKSQLDVSLGELNSRIEVLENTAVGKVAYGRLFSSDIDSAGKLVKIKVLLSDTGTPIATTYTAGYFSTADGGETLTWVDETGISGTVWQIIDTWDSSTEEIVDSTAIEDGGTWLSESLYNANTTLYIKEDKSSYTKRPSRQGISYTVTKVEKVTSDTAETWKRTSGTRTIDIDPTLGTENTWFKEIAPFSTARMKHIPVTIGGVEYDNVMTEMDPVMMNRIKNFSLSVPVKDATTGETLSTTEISGELWVFTCDEDMEFKATIDGVADTPCTFFRAPTFVDCDRVGKLSKGYFGRYEATKVAASTGTILVSQPTHAEPSHTSGRHDFLSYARRSNAGTNPEFALNTRSWSIEPLEDLHLIAFLLVVMSGNRNTQATFTGRTGSGSTASLYSQCGDCDPLLDENLAGVLTTYGYPEGVIIPGSFRARTSALSSFFFFEENPYGSKWKHRPDLDIRSITNGTVISDTLTAEGDYAYLFHCHDREAYDCCFHATSALTRDGITYPANPHSVRFAEVNGYVNAGVKWPLGLTSGYYGVAPVRSEATPWLLVGGHPRPSGTSGAATQGIGDCFWTTSAANVTSPTSAYSMNYVISGGSYYYGAAAGAFALNCYYYWTIGTVDSGVRPSFSLQGQGSGATAQ